MPELLPTIRDATIIWQAGDDTPTVVPVSDRSGARVDVTGWTAVAAVTANGAEVHRWSTLDGSAESGPDGVCLLSDDSESWGWTRGRYDVRVWAPDGTRRVVAVGDMLVRPVRSQETAGREGTGSATPAPGEPLPPRGSRRA